MQGLSASKSLNRLVNDSDPVNQMVVKIFQRYDTNKSGALSRKQTLDLINDIFEDRGQKKATVTTFNKIFAEFNLSKNGILSKTEVARFVRNFMLVPTLEQEVQEIVNNIWYDFDTDRSGQLNRKETLRFIKAFMSEKGRPAPSYIVFTRYFNEMDINKDGFISKNEMSIFMMNFLQPKISSDQIIDDMVFSIFQKYDKDRSGALNRRETLRLVNDLRAQNGQRPATHYQYNKLFNEFDYNGDGVLSPKEMTEFVRKFLNSAEADDQEIKDIVNRIWYKFDTDRSGNLNRRETLRFLNQFFQDQGQPPITSLYFNKLFAEFDVNKDGLISKAEMARFVVIFMSPKLTQDDMINEMVIKLFQKYDVDRSGSLNRRETHRVVNDIYASEGRRPVTNQQFNRIFNEFDINGDGQLSQREMTRFVVKFLHIPYESDEVIDIVNQIWYKYDKDRSGKLNRRETHRFLNDYLADQGRPPTTNTQFNQFFSKFDVNKDGQISKQEMAQFVRLFIEPIEVYYDDIADIVHQIWYKYDKDRSGKLNRRETLKFLNDFLTDQGRPPTTHAQFNQFFAKFDVNKDGQISKSEMAQFVRLFMDPIEVYNDDIADIVNQIWYKYDKDRSGKLNRRETLKFLNNFLADQGRPPTTNAQFNQFFAKFDVNKDGQISKREMAQFVRLFIEPTEDELLNQKVYQIFDNYDRDRSGYLDKRETLRLVNDILASRGQRQASISLFNGIFSQYDINGDGVLSRQEMKRFVRNILGFSDEDNEYDLIVNTVNKIWKQFDTDRSGKLNRRETLRFLNAFMDDQGKPSVTSNDFHRFFAEFDVDRDGFISKPEMARFVRLVMMPRQDPIGDMVNKIFDSYDTNCTGTLSKRNVLKLINDILKNQGRRPPSNTMFYQIFNQFDKNGDGVLSRKEMRSFVSKFLDIPSLQYHEILDIVDKIWIQFDTDRNGKLNRRETLRFLNSFLTKQGQAVVNNLQFNKFFVEFDVNKDGFISKPEMARFIGKFFEVPTIDDNYLDKVALSMFDMFDSNRDGKLGRKEALGLINEILAQQGLPPATFSQFQKFFLELDTNGDGVISRREVIRFVRLYFGKPFSLQQAIKDTINQIWYDFDTDRSGKLNRRETLRFLNSFLRSRGYLDCNADQFSNFYDKFDVNRDGFISKSEMARFVSQYMAPEISGDWVIEDMIQEIFIQYDTNCSGALDRRETKKLVDDIFASKGLKPVSYTTLKRIFQEFDVNGDGVLSQTEMIRFVKKFMNIQPTEEDLVVDTVHEIWVQFDQDKSGKLNRLETLKFLNVFMKSRGKPPVTNYQFKKFFEEFDVNKDGLISKPEMAQFVQLFMAPNLLIDETSDDILIDLVDQVFMQYDKNNSGQLDRYESYRLINDVYKEKGHGSASRYVFNRIFSEFDVNNDGVLSRQEIFRFVKSILRDDTDEVVKQTVNKIWKQFDIDRSGKLNKKETLRFLNAFLTNQGMHQATNNQFNRFFADFDVNKDGFISKSEMARFVRQYMEPPEYDEVDEMVAKIFLKYDKNKSGNLSRSETLKLLNDYLGGQGKRPASYSLFNRFFNEFDENGDGVLSQSEMRVFVKKFLLVEPTEDDQIMDIVDQIWDKYDTDNSGKLNRRETLRFLNAFLQSKGQKPATHLQFSRFFKKFDANGDGFISRNEMAQFVKLFMDPVDENDLVNEMVIEIFDKYDKDGNGTLERRETIRLVNDILAARGQRPVTYSIFNKFFQEFDQNGDGVLSPREVTEFVKRFFDLSDDDYHNFVMDIIDEIWEKFDADRSGQLNRRETLKFLIHFCSNQGQPPPSNLQFNRFFSEFDVDKNGLISKSEMAQFVLKFLTPQMSHDDFIRDMVETIFAKYDTNNNRFLEKNEVLKLLDEILSNQGIPQTTFEQFSEFFAEFDSNGDGVISKSECTRFVRKFLDNPNLFNELNEETSNSNNSINFTPSHQQQINQLYNSDNFQVEDLKIQVSKIDKHSIQNILENNDEQMDEFQSNNSIIIMPNNPPVNDIPLHMVHDVMVKCPYCLRMFSQEAAERHIPKCAKTKNRAKPPPSRNEVLEKKSARKKQHEIIREIMDSPTGITSMNPMKNKIIGRNKSQIAKAEKDLFTKKMSSTKDDVAGLVASGFVSELNNKQRVSPFPRKESQIMSKGSFLSKNSTSQKSSPNRYESPLFTQGAIQKNTGFQTQRNSMPTQNAHNFRQKSSSMIGKGVNVMACMKNQVVASSFVEKDSGFSIKQKLIKPSMASIKENFEEGNRKSIKKEWAHSDVKTRMKHFASVQCPYCLRMFSEKAADAHIEFCAKRAKRLPAMNTSPMKKNYDNSLQMNQVNDSRAKTARFDKNYYDSIQKRNNVSPYKNITPRVNSGLQSIDLGTSANLEQFKNNERMSERLAGPQNKQSKNGYRHTNTGRVESPIMAKYRNPLYPNTHQRQTPGFEQESTINFNSKFCTLCGAKFMVDTHRFCGECGATRN